MASQVPIGVIDASRGGTTVETWTPAAVLKKIDTPEVQSLAAIIGQTEQQGSSVALAFQDFADNVRLARRQTADERGNKTALKLLFPLVFCLAPPVYMMLLMPAAIEMSQFIKREAQPGGGAIELNGADPR